MDDFASARKRILIDFDGVIHKNDHWNWNDGKCTGPAIPGAKEAIFNLSRMGWEIVVFTARSSESIANDVCPWLEHNSIVVVKHDAHMRLSSLGYMYCGCDRPRVTNIKEPAQFYVDDRAYRFTNWDDVTRLVS